MIKRFVGHCVKHEGTLTRDKEVMYRLYCDLEKCPPDKKNCYICDHVTSEALP